MIIELNGSWPLDLPADRVEQWERWHAGAGWEVARLEAMHDVIADLATNAGTPATPGSTSPLPVPCVYDIGAERGDFTGLFATWGARVVIVEPTPGMWPHIRDVFERNDIAHSVAGCFVGFAGRFGDAPDPFAFVAGPWPPCSRGDRLPEPGFGHLNEPGNMTEISIDTLAQMVNEPPAVITVDVEGSELEVMRGAGWVLNTWRPEVFVSVHPDFMGDRYGQTPDELHDHMIARGYVPCHLATDHEEHWQYTPEERT